MVSDPSKGKSMVKGLAVQAALLSLLFIIGIVGLLILSGMA